MELFVVYSRIAEEIESPLGVYSIIELAKDAIEQDVIDAFPTIRFGNTRETEVGNNLTERLYLDQDELPIVCYVIQRFTLDQDPPKRDRSMLIG